ncbi:MAG TPA: WHG domain-containing protein [Anaerolineae bacterium]|nr:WHG domain-containing protein [Anaerolineae bacterium]
MPYPSQIDREQIVSTARELLVAHGIEAVTLRRVAGVLGVKAPSLYRYIKNKNELLVAINEATSVALFAELGVAAEGEGSLVERLVGVAEAYRRYAHAHPVCYALAMSSNPELKPPQATQVGWVLPLQALFAELATEAESLAALRGAYAFLHGWVILEIGQQLQRGGDLNAHFAQSFRAYLAGWERG